MNAKECAGGASWAAAGSASRTGSRTRARIVIPTVNTQLGGRGKWLAAGHLHPGRHRRPGHNCPRILDQTRPMYSCQERSSLLMPDEVGKKSPRSTPVLTVVKPVGEGSGS